MGGKSKMQLVLAVILISGCSYLGYGLGNYYHIRKAFIGEVITFLNLLKVEISFLKSSVSSIIKTHLKEFKTPFKQVLKNYLKLVEEIEQIELLELEKSLKSIYLEEIEQQKLNGFFNSLGRTDTITQTKNIETFLVFFHNYLLLAEKQRHKYAGMFSKLGFLTGIFLVILLL